MTIDKSILASPPATRVFVDPNIRYSSRGPRYTVRLGTADGEIIVTESLVPFYDAARALSVRGITGRLELGDGERRYARMTGELALSKRLRIEESESISPRVRRWRPFAGGRDAPKTANLVCPKNKSAADARGNHCLVGRQR